MTAPKLAVQQPDGSRRYVHPLTGETVPAISTVNGMIAKPALIDWAARMAAQHAITHWDRLSGLPSIDRMAEMKTAHTVFATKKADIGDAVHDLIDDWAKGIPAETTKQTDSYVTNFINFMVARKPRFIENEVTVWSRRYGYAGTADWLAEIDGKLILGDNKTGRRVYDEVGLQLSALAGADFIIRDDGSEEPMPEIDGLAALHIRPRSWKLIPVYERGECFAAFLAARRLWHWQNEVAPNIFQGE